MDIVALLQCLAPYLNGTTVRQMSTIITAILALSGRVTMLGISRWTGKGGSYRTVQRFYNSAIPWALVFWVFFRTHLFHAQDTYLLAGDECVVPKAGKRTYGLDRFFSSLYGKPIPGLAFFTLSLLSTRERRSYPMMVEQMLAHETGKAAKRKGAQRQAQAGGAPKPRSVGRPRGSRNQDKRQIRLTPELQLIQNMVLKQLLLLNGLFSLTYLVLDGHFGHHNAVYMARQCGLGLISKLRSDAALYCPYLSADPKPGPRRKYGDKLNYEHLPAEYLKSTTLEGELQTDIYQAQLLHKAFALPLNVVIICKTHRQTHACAHVVLFSSDLALSYEHLIDYYGLRFQIEFNFREAKQYWGLDDFMNVKVTPVTNAANLALFMVDVGQQLLTDFRQIQPQCGVLDLKAYCRGHRYVTETLKLLPEMPEPILLASIYAQVAALGSIHQPQPAVYAP